MPIAKSKLTAQGQISVPAEVRRILGIGPGSVLEWEDSNGKIVVRKSGRHTSAEIQLALFGTDAPNKQPIDTHQAIRTYIRKRRARH